MHAKILICLVTQRSLMMMMIEKSRKELRQKGELCGILTMPTPLPSHKNPKDGQDFSVVFNPAPPNPPFNLFAQSTSVSCVFCLGGPSAMEIEKPLNF